MMYDPVARGQYPVGVRSFSLHDSARADRRLELEVWYPAAARHRGQDRALETQDCYPIFGAYTVRQEAVRAAEALAGPFPVVLFSHGMAGHRRQSSFLCTHLASHGYLVIAPDHGGSTIVDLVNVAMRVRSGQDVPADVEAQLAGFVSDRPGDVCFLLDALGEGTLPLPSAPELGRIAAIGHSFGGFTALAAASLDRRIAAVVALAPAGGEGPLSTPALRSALSLAFPREVATLYLGLERDTLLPLAGVEQLYRRTPPPARMFVLANADHMHFCDRAESSHEFFRALPPLGVLGELTPKLAPFSALAPEAHGYAFAKALCLGHLDDTLRGSEPARAFMEESAVGYLAQQGVVSSRLEER